jgi:hypothetical protein
LGLNKELLDKSRYCTDTYVLVSMNGAAIERARAEAERVAAANAAGNHGGPPDAPPLALQLPLLLLLFRPAR